jgi:hypothetical protein
LASRNEGLDQFAPPFLDPKAKSRRTRLYFHNGDKVCRLESFHEGRWKLHLLLNACSSTHKPTSPNNTLFQVSIQR